MYAIVDINGQQVSVEEGRYIFVNRLPQEKDATLSLDKVLMVVNDDNPVVGAPYINGATVEAKVLEHLRGPKKIVYKMRCKKGYRRKNGYRDSLTKLEIVSLAYPGQPKTKAATASKSASKEDSADDTPKKKKTTTKAKTADSKPAEKKSADKKQPSSDAE